MNWTNLLHHFTAGSRMHFLVNAAMGLLIVGLALAGRRFGDGVESSAQPECRRFRNMLAAALLAAWAASFVRNFCPDRLGWSQTLPLHVCDIAGLVAPAALYTGRRQFRAVLHYWGLGFSIQAFIAPILRDGPAHIDFWLYWLSHGAIVAAAIYDIAVLGFRPLWTDWRTSVRVGTFYIAGVAGMDALLHANYGYLGDTSMARGTLIFSFGPWPGRLPFIAATSFALMAAMTLVWEVPPAMWRLASVRFAPEAQSAAISRRRDGVTLARGIWQGRRQTSPG